MLVIRAEEESECFGLSQGLRRSRLLSGVCGLSAWHRRAWHRESPTSSLKPDDSVAPFDIVFFDEFSLIGDRDPFCWPEKWSLWRVSSQLHQWLGHIYKTRISIVYVSGTFRLQDRPHLLHRLVRYVVVRRNFDPIACGASCRDGPWIWLYAPY